MTARTAIVVWVIAAFLLPTIGEVGALFKIQNWPRAWLWQVVLNVTSAIMAILVVYKLLRHPGLKDFLDR